MRTSPVHYIAPSAISIVPNANGSQRDLSVFVAKGAKIKVHCNAIAALKPDPDTNTYREWTLSGRNRRLDDATGAKEYTIYARLPINDTAKGYLMFAPKEVRPEGLQDKYCYVTTSGVSPQYSSGNGGASVRDYQNWWIRLGDVSLPENGQRTVTLDTGILGTDRYNEEWNFEPDDMPLRIVLSGTIDGEAAGGTPFVSWDQCLTLAVRLVEGWESDADSRVRLWTIARNTGDPTGDASWNAIDRSEGFGTSGTIDLAHERHNDDFAGAVATVFTIAAWGDGGGSDSSDAQLTKLAEESVTVLSETYESYELETSVSVVSIDSSSGAYTPADGVTVRVMARAQDGTVSYPPQTHLNAAGLHLYYQRVDDEESRATELPMTDGTGTLPATLFAGKSINIWLENGAHKVLARTTVACVKDGEGSYEIELTEYVDVITVDDAGNVIGGLWTVEGQTRQYRIMSAVNVWKGGTLLTLAGTGYGDSSSSDGDEDLTGKYRLYHYDVGCTAMLDDSTVIITSIDHVKDGVSGTGDDGDFDYDAMRAVESCRVDVVIDIEGRQSVTKSFPVTIKHDSRPYVGADITNEHSGVAWNSRTKRYIGLPVSFDVKMWHNSEVLDIADASHISLSSATDGVLLLDADTGTTPAEGSTAIYYRKTVVTQNGHKVAHVELTSLDADIPLVCNIDVTTDAVYAGVSYERTLRHTLTKTTDTNVYSLLPSVNEIILTNDGLSTTNITCQVVCDSSDDKHYNLRVADLSDHRLALYYRKYYADGSSDQSETPYAESSSGSGEATGVSVDDSVSEIRFFLYGLTAGGAVDGEILHDTESVPVITNGKSDTWTIGNDGYWYKNGDKYTDSEHPDGIKAEGQDGTGIELKGTVDVVLNSDKTSNAQTSLEGLSATSGVTLQVGDCYMVTANGWLYFHDGTTAASAGAGDIPKNPAGWKPVGKIKGEPGSDATTFYYHIAYADSITMSNGTVTAQSGFTTVKSKTAYAWMGICTDANQADPGATAATEAQKLAAAQAYDWNLVKGKAGDDAVNYFIETGIDSIAVGYGQTANATTFAAFYRKTGAQSKSTILCYYAVYRRTGSTYAILTNGYNDGCNINVQVSQSDDALAIYAFASSYTGLSPHQQAYYASKEIIVNKQGRTGEDGEDGKPGKMFYLMGTYDSTFRYVIDEQNLLIPTVYYARADGSINPVLGVSGDYFFLKKSMPTAGHAPSSVSEYWNLAEHFGLVITQGIFADFAKLSKAIVSGDFLFSMDGRIWTSATACIETADGANYTHDGVTKPAYTWFRGDPTQQHEFPFFEPNRWDNLKTGKLSAARGNFVVQSSGNVEVRGTVKADNLYRTLALSSGNQYLTGGSGNDVPLAANTATIGTDGSWVTWVYFRTDHTQNGVLFSAGKYYTSQQIEDANALSPYNALEWQHEPEICSVCTGPADEVFLTDNYGLDPGTFRGIVMIPRCEDYMGKMITIRHTISSGNNAAEIRQCDLATGKFVEGALLTGWAYNISATAEYFCTVAKGETVVLYSIGIAWMVTSRN